MSMRRPPAPTPIKTPSTKRGEHLPTLALSAFWFWIVLLVLICGCGALFLTVIPSFSQHPAAPPQGHVPASSELGTSAPEATAPATAAATSAATAAATQAATAAPDAAITAKVVEDTVNARGTPDTQGTIIGKLKKNQQLTLTGRTDDSKWYQTTLAGHSDPVWVFADTLQVNGDPSTLPVVQ